MQTLCCNQQTMSQPALPLHGRHFYFTKSLNLQTGHPSLALFSSVMSSPASGHMPCSYNINL